MFGMSSRTSIPYNVYSTDLYEAYICAKHVRKNSQSHHYIALKDVALEGESVRSELLVELRPSEPVKETGR